MRRSLRFIGAVAVAFAFMASGPLEAAQQRSRTTARSKAPARATTAQRAYEQTLARERSLRASRRKAPLSQMRAVVKEYESIARRWPRSGYADNALWNGANLAYDANISYGARQDRDTAIQMLRWLVKEYPASSLVSDANTRLKKISAASARTTRTDAVARATKTPSTPPPAATELAKANIRTADAETAPEDKSKAASPTPAAPSASPVTVRDVKRVVLPEVVRVTIELDKEVAYHEEALQNPSRLFFDLRGASLGPNLEEGTRAFDDGDIAREIRLGTHPGGVTRVVVDTRGVARHSLFTLYNPYRLVLDLYREPSLSQLTRSDAPATPATSTPIAPPAPPAAAPSAAAGTLPAPASVPERVQADATPLPSSPAAPSVTTTPAAPESNKSGSYSLARQLGLGVSRIVIDPGHGGHDPGSLGDGIKEAELVLDVALRLEALLKQEPGIDVVMTRRTDQFVELEERTRIANRQSADLFLSIHANSSRRRTAQGVETFVLNFANNTDAEEVAARENAIAKGSMRQLPDIVKAITLNNKLDESRDLAETVQSSLVSRLRRTYADLPDRGIKQAPLVVLIGASMPSVLAEIGFVSTPEEGKRLKTSAYRQEIAVALRDAVLRYQRSLKGGLATASRSQEQEER